MAAGPARPWVRRPGTGDGDARAGPGPPRPPRRQRGEPPPAGPPARGRGGAARRPPGGADRAARRADRPPPRRPADGGDLHRSRVASRAPVDRRERDPAAGALPATCPAPCPCALHPYVLQAPPSTAPSRPAPPPPLP